MKEQKELMSELQQNPELTGEVARDLMNQGESGKVRWNRRAAE